MSKTICDAGCSDQTGVGRRDLLKGAAAAAVVLAPGVTLVTAAKAETGAGVRWGLLIDSGKCTQDCTACVAACTLHNGLTGAGRPETDPQWIRKVELRNKTTGSEHSLPMMCQHCDKPPCVDVCPTGASFKRADGIVLVDRHICIGCRYCMMACPYKARSFVHEHLEGQTEAAPRGLGTVEACNLCVTRVDEGLQPACVDACAGNGNGAMLFGDLNDPNSAIARRVSTYATTQLRSDLDLGTSVRYQGI